MEKKKAPQPVADINVTPMVDVMLVLLIIFMVITPLLTKGTPVDLVRTKNPIQMQAADKEDAILIAVTRNGGIFLSPGNLLSTTCMCARHPPTQSGELGVVPAGDDQDRHGQLGHERVGDRRPAGWSAWWPRSPPTAA